MRRPEYINAGSICFGMYTKLPKLPKGFVWIQSPNEWLMVRDDIEQFWFVKTTGEAILLIRRRCANLWDWVRTAGKLRPGTIYADFENTLLLPNHSARGNAHPHQ